ncbi:MAG: hypothetical protein HKP62_01475 [Sulfurovum sp.]|nr:hypothetical protein [Sulfurovum sp.]NNJ44665.1 hypothetical protein [Sulfurovum sp.]
MVKDVKIDESYIENVVKDSKVKFMKFSDVVSIMEVRKVKGEKWFNCRNMVNKVGKDMGFKKRVVDGKEVRDFEWEDFKVIWSKILESLGKLGWLD